ncbi:MAG: ABC transporter substrate-binding protein [Chloroflexi bacterium]|nr:ABC transporter substrate-binding protein [Chloroflexota bacterium]
MKICSLLPSGTEILFALGLGDRVAGVTYYCDYPPEASTRAIVSRPRVDTAAMTAGAIHEATRELDASGHGTYQLDISWLQREKPDLILTQNLCRVCDVNCAVVEDAISDFEPRPSLIYLAPQGVAGILETITTVGAAAGAEGPARTLVDGLKERIQTVERAVSGLRRPRVCQLEWLDPIAAGGHWFPELVGLAGGTDTLNGPGESSIRVSWQRILNTDPEVIILAPCSYPVGKTLRELASLVSLPSWWQLEAVRAGKVFVVDSALLTRPGPRVADGLEVLAKAVHPGAALPKVPRGVAVKSRPVIGSPPDLATYVGGFQAYPA